MEFVFIGFLLQSILTNVVSSFSQIEEELEALVAIFDDKLEYSLNEETKEYSVSIIIRPEDSGMCEEGFVQVGLTLVFGEQVG